MFRAAVLRLTLWYLFLIMLLSICFSVALYRVSTRELSQNEDRLQGLLRSNVFMNDGGGFSVFHDARIAQLEDSREKITWSLIYFNLAVLLGGGAASFFLARRTLEPIEESLEQQQRFTADASHELRTPLTSIKSELEVALRDKKLTLAESKKVHKSTLEEVGRLETLANGLLRLAKQDSNGRVKHFEVITLETLVSDAVNQVAKAAEKKQISLVYKPTEGSVEGERWGLVELLSILLENAIKYSPKKSTVTIETKTRTTKTYLQVRDEGPGIAADDLPHIFNRFYRGDRSRTKNATHGYGLGLSIAQKIVHLHHGSIEAQSDKTGSRFTVVIPNRQPRNLLPS